MAIPTTCSKCGKELSSKSYARIHEKKCKGEGAVQRTPESSNGGGVIAKAIDDLKAKREQIISEIPEVKELNEAIAALEKRRGGGNTNPS